MTQQASKSDRVTFRIAYLASGIVATEASGVMKKIDSQIREWRRRGHDARLFALVNPGADLSVIERMKPSVLIQDQPIRTQYLLKDLWNRHKNSSRLASQLAEWKPDIIYHRFGTFFPSFLKLQDRIPTVLEINTDDVAEMRLLQPVYKTFYKEISRKKALRSAAGAVFLTHELAGRDYFKDYIRQSTVIANGIDFQSYPQIHTVAADRQAEPQLAFLASPGLSWHGLDQLFELARAMPKWGFHVIGPSAPVQKDEGPSVPSNVVFYGEISQKEFGPILQKVDFGIGVLALERKKMKESCPLKVREYLAYGLPVILKDLDTDFSDPTWFVLQLPPDSKTLVECSPLIEDYAKRYRGKKVDRSEIQHLDIQQKETYRLSFFSKILNQKVTR